ncbi:MAG TPA: tRNA uridine-5-carboxymethylaminomethyl(34) synthesis enzyme MnmG [Candidatus Avirikenella pullistercoris]|nr:tRNA uridine-5-carboxymethylaminomethyl(34) synthesis enzyme MnmG [Candidatus Avirikenella pullistercoris]
MTLAYDIIVVGGGHAGCEAAAAAATMGSKTLLITMDMAKFAYMSCNPAVGGVAKGQIVREIDALGGQMGIITDKSTIQFRMLNRSKGPAMWSPRAQCDKQRFSLLWRETLENTPNLYLWQDNVIRIEQQRHKITGVYTQLGVQFTAKAVILTNGTFLNGLIHVGRSQMTGGRFGDMASFGLSEQLAELGFEVGRMKTGTPARLDARTIDFSVLTPQEGDAEPAKFSFLPEIAPVKQQLPCYLAYTSTEVHDKLREGFADSPLFNGTIEGIGPRYCPSIEDKLHTFAGKNEHQLFLEPEGSDTTEYYLNGFSSSLPWQIQFEALQKIKGLENVHLFRPGYAIEYDFFQPTQLHHTLETKLIENLYFAGQINGTTGYEEAGAQGLIAGINAHLKINGKPSFILNRNEAYIGVLIDDLVTKGVDEPYRMFTSRAEYRILLRQDNADIRLTERSYEIGLASEKRFRIAKEKQQKIELLHNFIKQYSVSPQELNPYLDSLNSSPLTQKRKLNDIILRNEISLRSIIPQISELELFISKNKIDRESIEEVEILIKYGGYIEREKSIAEKLERLENIKIRPEFDFNSLHSLSIEARQKLSRIQPATIGQASRIPGVSPADINVLLVYFGR